MYGNDATLYVISKSIDKVVLYAWWIDISLTPRSKKNVKPCFFTEDHFTVLLPLIIGNNLGKWVTCTRLLGVNVDSKLDY